MTDEGKLTKMTAKEYIKAVRDYLGVGEELKLVVNAESGAIYFVNDDGKSFTYNYTEGEPRWWGSLPWDFPIDEDDESAADANIILDIEIVPGKWELPEGKVSMI